jgi:hypothetical protein
MRRLLFLTLAGLCAVGAFTTFLVAHLESRIVLRLTADQSKQLFAFWFEVSKLGQYADLSDISLTYEGSVVRFSARVTVPRKSKDISAGVSANGTLAYRGAVYFSTDRVEVSNMRADYRDGKKRGLQGLRAMANRFYARAIELYATKRLESRPLFQPKANVQGKLFTAIVENIEIRESILVLTLYFGEVANLVLVGTGLLVISFACAVIGLLRPHDPKRRAQTITRALS